MFHFNIIGFNGCKIKYQKGTKTTCKKFSFRKNDFKSNGHGSGISKKDKAAEEEAWRRTQARRAAKAEAAAKEQTAVLPGKHYSIEGNSEIKVAGLVEDGPVPMGPLVYVTAGDRQIVSLSCRCSPSRIDKADVSLHYGLITSDGPIPASAEFAARLPTSEQALRALRIPRDF